MSSRSLKTFQTPHYRENRSRYTLCYLYCGMRFHKSYTSSSSRFHTMFICASYAAAHMRCAARYVHYNIMSWFVPEIIIVIIIKFNLKSKLIWKTKSEPNTIESELNKEPNLNSFRLSNKGRNFLHRQIVCIYRKPKLMEKTYIYF